MFYHIVTLRKVGNYMGNFSILAIRIKELRKSLKMTQKEFSEFVGCTAATLSAYENDSKSPSLEIIKGIAEKCNISIDWLCGLSDSMSNSDEYKTYKDLATALIDIDYYAGIVFSTDKDDKYDNSIYFDDPIINDFIAEWFQATLIRDNRKLNKKMAASMYESWKKDKLEELSNKNRCRPLITADTQRSHAMPKLKPSPQEDRNRLIRAIIVGNQERYAISDESVAKYLNMSLTTFRKKKARPVNFDLMDIHALSRYLKFTPVQAASIALGRDITAKEVKDFILM